ncbi:MAG: ZIP family metal transporter [Patescibacteria group bacterium]|nr:ZIP family metal transporter [Patescibacteria group bacterium]
MLPTAYIAIILLSFLSVITTLIGVGLAFYFKKSKKGIVIGIGFSAGIMLIISFLELLPEAVKASGFIPALIALILGIFLIFSLHFIIPHTHYVKEKGHLPWQVKTAYLVALGLILHDFPEGFAMANSYIYAPALGILVAISIAIHNIPEEFAMAVPLVIVKKKRALINLAVLSGLAEPLGAVFGLCAVSIAPTLNPLFMAFAAGAMIFISFHELYPMAQRYKKLSCFALGGGLSLLVYFGLSLIF